MLSSDGDFGLKMHSTSFYSKLYLSYFLKCCLFKLIVSLLNTFETKFSRKNSSNIFFTLPKMKNQVFIKKFENVSEIESSFILSLCPK